MRFQKLFFDVFENKIYIVGCYKNVTYLNALLSNRTCPYVVRQPVFVLSSPRSTSKRVRVTFCVFQRSRESMRIKPFKPFTRNRYDSYDASSNFSKRTYSHSVLFERMDVIGNHDVFKSSTKSHHESKPRTKQRKTRTLSKLILQFNRPKKRF